MHVVKGPLTAYWPSVEDGQRKHATLIKRMEILVDVLQGDNAHHATRPIESIPLACTATVTRSISILESIVALKKMAPIVAGQRPTPHLTCGIIC